MNRRERKKMEKDLGLQKFYKNQSRTQKWERMRENQENGKRMHEQNVIKNEENQLAAAEDKMNAIIANKAANIATKKKIPMIDAMVEATNEY
jgi:hypothetical protein